MACPSLFFPMHLSLSYMKRLMRKSMVIEMEDFFQVGIITSTHGLKGEVKVFPTTDDVKRFKRLKEVILDTGKERIDLEVESAKFFKQFVIECS